MMWNFNSIDNNVALIEDSGLHITYYQLNAMSRNLSNFFSGKKLVFCLCKNTIGSILGYVTFVNSKQVPLLLNSELDSSLLHFLFDTYKPQYMWIPKEQLNLFSDLSVIYNIYDYVLIKTNFNDNTNINDELALLLTTSGSTGSPKLVRQSYKNIKANTESIVEYLKIDKNEKAITTLPMNYTYGLSIINSHLYAGATLLLTDKSILEKEFWHFFKEYNATSFGGVPYTYEILEKLRFFKMDLPSLKTMTQAGGKLLPSLHEKFAKYALENNKDFVVMYGQTEATARMAYLPAEKSLEKFGSMGFAIPGGKFELYDLNSNVITENDVVGELVYYGDNVTLGYAEELSDLEKGDERHGKLVTGDMAYRDKDGYHFVVGRKKRFLKIFGNRVNLDEIERMIKKEFNIMNCACSGYDDNLFIFLVEDFNTNDIKTFLEDKTKLNRAAFNVKFIEKIPKNDSGKILYKEFKEHF
ncbi:AMP-binding protein [Candidatus Izemoplasma sp. B36]|uniref:AMP-binding protein n=1 Tax=Candidatus Izemoplasma sp. B36 TaxID=3242468 RepID=UPI0035565B78